MSIFHLPIIQIYGLVVFLTTDKIIHFDFFLSIFKKVPIYHLYRNKILFMTKNAITDFFFTILVYVKYYYYYIISEVASKDY